MSNRSKLNLTLLAANVELPVQTATGARVALRVASIVVVVEKNEQRGSEERVPFSFSR